MTGRLAAVVAAFTAIAAAGCGQDSRANDTAGATACSNLYVYLHVEKEPVTDVARRVWAAGQEATTEDIRRTAEALGAAARAGDTVPEPEWIRLLRAFSDACARAGYGRPFPGTAIPHT